MKLKNGDVVRMRSKIRHIISGFSDNGLVFFRCGDMMMRNKAESIGASDEAPTCLRCIGAWR